MAALGAAAWPAAALASIEATSPDASLRIGVPTLPAVLAEQAPAFSFMMWLHRSAHDPQPMSVLYAPDSFAVMVDPGAEVVRVTLIGGSGTLGLDLPLRDGGGSVPVGQWMLIAASWDAAVGRFEAWAESETVPRVEAVTVAPGFIVSAPTGDLVIGRPAMAGFVAQRGRYGLMVFRDHSMSATDFDRLWQDRDYFGPYRLDNTAAGGSFNGTPGASWMVHHAILSKPVTGVIPVTTPALVGGPVATTNYCILETQFPNPFVRAGRVTSASTGDAAFVFLSPYEPPEPGAFFSRIALSIGLPGPPAWSAFPSPRIRQLAWDLPTDPTRVIVSANSRGVLSSDAEEQTLPENYAHGFITARLGSTIGVLNRPAKTISNDRWFGYDCLAAPRKSGTITQVDATEEPSASFGRFCTNSNRTTGLGPGICLFFADGALLSMKCRPEAGSLMDGSAGDGSSADFPLTVSAYVLKFPGAGTAVWKPEKSTSQSALGMLGAGGSVDLDTAVFTHALSAAAGDEVDALGRTLTLGGDHSADILAGDACYICCGDGAKGIAIVESVSVIEGPKTFLDFDYWKWFPVHPALDSSVLRFGPWSVERLDHDWAALSPADPQIWRGLELSASGGPIVVLSYDALRTGAAGFAFGTYGTGGDGYAEQMAEAFPQAHERLIAALEPDIWLEGFAQQSSTPASMLDFLNVIRGGAPDVEAAWIGESAHGAGPGTSWHQYILDNAAAAGVPAATVVEEPLFGAIEDQAADGLRHDDAHYSHRGNTRLAEAWLDLLRQAATSPGDLDGDGIVGVADLLLLLGAWGPCPGPCPPACLADTNGDCAVNVADLLTLLADWG